MLFETWDYRNNKITAIERQLKVPDSTVITANAQANHSHSHTPPRPSTLTPSLNLRVMQGSYHRQQIL